METTTTTQEVKAKKNSKKFYIGARHNPQFQKPYYKAYGQLSKTDAKAKEKCSYGSMYLTAYETEQEYLNAQEELKANGFRIC